METIVTAVGMIVTGGGNDSNCGGNDSNFAGGKDSNCGEKDSNERMLNSFCIHWFKIHCKKFFPSRREGVWVALILQTCISTVLFIKQW